jgi:hypothetical protein
MFQMPGHSVSKSGRVRTRRKSARPEGPRGRSKVERMDSGTFRYNVPPSYAAPLSSVSLVLTSGSISNANLEREDNSILKREFKEHVERWKAATRHISSVTKMILHPSYMRIIGMGPAVLPLILRELKERPDHWFVALNAITGIDAAPPKSTFEEAINAWLDWGINRGYSR